MQVGAVIGLACMQAAGKLLNILGHDSELAQISSHGTNYLNLPVAWQEGTADCTDFSKNTTKEKAVTPMLSRE